MKGSAEHHPAQPSVETLLPFAVDLHQPPRLRDGDIRSRQQLGVLVYIWHRETT
jgi:hypothetical protein